MRINPTDGLPQSLSAPAASAERGETRGAEPAAKTPVSFGESLFTPTTDLSRWLEMVKISPEIRPEVVRDVTTRLAMGELDTPSAAADTAAAIAAERNG